MVPGQAVSVDIQQKNENSPTSKLPIAKSWTAPGLPETSWL